MPGEIDEKGLLSQINRHAAENELFYILVEMVQNRKWNDDKSKGKFVFATFDIEDKRYLVIGYNHFRSEQSIENEHTPFNWREATDIPGEATIGTRGYGAKLLPFKIGGQYSNYYHLKNNEIFPDGQLHEWGMKQSINITKLQERLNSKKDISSHMHEYRETYINPCNSKEGVVPVLLINAKFTSSELYSFFKKENFKYFYIFSGYNIDIDTCLDSTLQRLANLYEGNTAEIYQSKDLFEPKLLTTNIDNSLGLCDKWWAGEFTLEWMIGEKDNKYWKSICRYYNKNTDEEIFSKLDSNGSKDKKFNIRHHQFKKEDLETGWVPDISVTVALTTDNYAKTIRPPEVSRGRIYIKLQGDVIDDSSSDFGLLHKIRYLEDINRVRVILSILTDNVKKNSDFGLHLEHLKKNSNFSKDGAINEMISQTLARAKNYIQIIKENGHIGSPEMYANKLITDKFTRYMQVDTFAKKRSNDRKKEGIKYETSICKALDQEFEDIEWDHNDSNISSEHDLSGEGIDSLGTAEINGKTLWIALQIKDKEKTITKSDKDKFISTLGEFREKYPNDICLAYLVLAKDKSFTAALSREMIQNDISTIVDPNGEITVKSIKNDLSKLMMLIS
jgi:hypothetical protein